METTASDLIGELRGVRDSVEELYILLDHIWRNRDELHEILVGFTEGKMEDREDETITCCRCEASRPSLAAAIREGWTDFQYDHQQNWNYLAICPDCRTADVDSNRRQPRIVSVPAASQQEHPQSEAHGAPTAPPALHSSGITRPSDKIPETIACARCDVDSPPSLAAALQEGWTDLCRDDGAEWNYLGLCPQCQVEEIERDRRMPERARGTDQKSLF